MSEPQQPSAQPHPPASPYGAPPQGAPAYGAPQHGAPQYSTPTQSTPPYGAPQYGAPQHGAPAATYGAPASGNTLGRTAFIVAVATAGIGILFSVITPFLYTSGNYDVADSLGTVIGILVLLGGIAAAVLSILALRRPAPHLLAAIALGIAGSVVVGRVITWFASLLYYLF